MKSRNIMPLSSCVLIILILSSCGKSTDGITAIGTWGGNELLTFQKIADGAGTKLKFETTRDLDALLAAKIKSGNLPDIAVLPRNTPLVLPLGPVQEPEKLPDLLSTPGTRSSSASARRRSLCTARGGFCSCCWRSIGSSK